MKPLVYKRRAHQPQRFRAPQPVLTITKGDTVRVIRGEFKGKEGKVLRVFPRKARVVVELERRFTHRFFGKQITRSKRVAAHDEQGAHLGDKVRIVETRPLSKTKRWRVVDIVERAK